MDVKSRVGVLGAGVMAHTHVQSLLAIPGTELLGVSAPEVDPRLSQLCETESIPVRDDADWLLGDTGIEAVVIATPTDTHAALVQQAAAAGLHVFCEKPLARTVGDARAAVDACASAGVKLSVGHVVRYFTAYAQMRDAVQGGEIGPPGMAKCQRVSGPPAAARAWYADTTRSGGLIMDMGVHDFDWLRWCLGPVERVSALARVLQPGQQVAMVTLAHHSGAISTVELSWMDPKGFATAVEVSGPKGLLTHDSRSSAGFGLDLWPARTVEKPAVQVPVRETVDNPYRQELADALQWFGGGPAPRSSGIDGVAAVAVAEAAHLSAQSREPVVMTEFAPEGAS